VELPPGYDGLTYRLDERVAIMLARDATLTIANERQRMFFTAEWPDHPYDETTPELFNAWLRRRIGLALTVFETIDAA
jgi:hypothetical protein